jgi:hypothetical protein
MEQNSKTNKQSGEVESTSAAEVLASLGVEAQTIYDGDPGGCPHCAGVLAVPRLLGRAA